MGTKRTAKPNIRPDWMKKSPKVSKEYTKKRAQIVREWDIWPTHSNARMTEAFIKAELVSKIFLHVSKLPDTKDNERLKAEAADFLRMIEKRAKTGRARAIAIAFDSLMLGAKLEANPATKKMMDSYGKQDAGRKSGANRIKKDADERYEYARAQFAAIKKEGLISPRYRIVAEAIKRTQAKFGIKPKLFKGRKETKIVTWPNKATKGRIFKGMK